MGAITISLAAPQFIGAQSVEKSTATSEFAYKAKVLRDPFVPLAVMAGSGSGGGIDSSRAQAYKTTEDVEAVFEPDTLILKAILKDAKKGLPMAYLISGEQEGSESFIIKGTQIRHASSGLVLKSYEARIEAQSVVIRKAKGETVVAVVNFPKKEGEAGQ